MHNPRRGILYTAPPNPDGERESTATHSAADAEREEGESAIAASEPGERLTADD